ncbi:SDR family oxidoreductase [Phycicoccus sp. 3266]|uniref:SDR family oxidoreductase n=1 Tax=Phycicoccus sp. 3266 TaxID=2817751 RepID=UPI0028656255|nr:SDR family oxidoreductase [Phycicoccus sp. 3266]MDR6863233.1 nucleoside-diphosphate-sugar epimerase [Phycicoccus sp. 3266]
MRVFVTGASGWIGSAVVPELLAAGHEVSGLARTDTSAAALEGRGVTVVRGDLDDLDSLRRGARAAEAVVHLANKHDWSNPAESVRAERAAVETLTSELEGSGRRLLLASGVAFRVDGRAPTEDEQNPARGPQAPRGGTESLAMEFVERGVHSVALRFAPTVHGRGDHGFIASIVDVARRTGVAAYPGDGDNRWSAVHLLDAARLVALALDASPAGSAVHAVAEEGVTTRDIAEAIGARLGLPTRSVAPDDVADHFGWIGGFFAMDLSAGSDPTRARLGWSPTHPTLLEDIAAGAYDGA